ncbi:MAG: response regulator [Planctomycetes bacterium]|nr:response regulator [Planctomycetota bacterium]
MSSRTTFRILLVEDNVNYHILTRRALEAEHIPCEIETAVSGDDCLERLTHCSYDLILLDYSLPGMDGLRLLKELRARNYLLPVVMVTGMGNEEIAVQAMKLGAYDYLVKSDKLVYTVPLIVRKVMERVKLENSLRETAQAKSRLEELDRLKSEFISNVSHELRTPLVSISGYAELLIEEKMGPITDKQRRALEISMRNIRRLKGIIDSLILYAGLEAKRRPLARMPFALQHAITEAVESFRPDCQKKDILLSTELPAAPLMVFADESLFDQVLANLLGNALKFTEIGGRIIVRAERAEGNCAAIHVVDTGCGIPRHMQHHVFERFWQADGSMTRKFGGIGLGLAIVKEILDAHQCPISVASEEGKGTTFTFTLPLAGAAEPGGKSAGTGVRAGESAAVRPTVGRILVVDDETDIRDFLQALLGSAGYQVLLAPGGAEALTMLESEAIDLVLLDIAMQGMDGITILQEIRGRERVRTLPVWMLSARVESGVRERAEQHGASGFVSKPFVPDDLLSSLSRFFAQKAGAT